MIPFSQSGNFNILVFFFAIASYSNKINSIQTLDSEELTDSLSRCPKTSNITITLTDDSKLCNVYHECYCGIDNVCEFVQSHVCPSDMVFKKDSKKCEPIDKIGCVSSYLHWISPNFISDSFQSKNIPVEHVNVTGRSKFTCPSYATNDRFPDPDICNVFHVCVKRDNVTYDQPFLCPFSSIFRVNDSKTMYCDVQTSPADCQNKAFYRSVDAVDIDEFIKSNSLIIETSNSSGYKCLNNLRYEDNHNCNTFHVCSNGKDEHYMCENDLMFNPISRMCDYPINVQCFDKKIFKKSDLLNAPSKEEKVLKSKMQSLILYPSESFNDVDELNIYGYRIQLKCPIGAKNYIYPDREFCNVFHHCHGFSGKVSICDKGQAFDPLANGIDESGVCNFENLVDCTGKFLLTESGKRAGKGVKNPESKALYKTFKEKYEVNDKNKLEESSEELINGILFDCTGKPNGHYRDYIYCDIFHACISNERKKTYSCAHMGQRTYFDDTTKRCEFLSNKPSVCLHNLFYKEIVYTPEVLPVRNFVDEYNEKWKIFIRSRESFTCIGRTDGFYASRWCNVFYRCFLGIRTEFLCPKMLNKGRLWWVKHDSSQEVAQTSAACVWPCETKNKCMSPGGTVIQKPDGSYGESIEESNRVWEDSDCEGNSDLRKENRYGISEKDFSCRGKIEGEFYSSKYCNVFHRCANGKRTDFKCPKATNTPYDLWWNEEEKQCDWPCKLNCTKTVHGTAKNSFDIQAEDLYYNEQECTAYKNSKTTPTPAISMITTKLIKKPFPDEGFVCPGPGLVTSPKYCNVYYSCKGYNMSPQFSFYCVDGHFDGVSKTCKTKAEHACSYSPKLVYPLIAISDLKSAEDVQCASSLIPYVKNSQRYGNVYYECNGHSIQPKTYRCFDREHLEDAYFNKDLNQCVRKPMTKSYRPFDILKVKTRYQSSPVDHTRFSDLKPLSCRADQQYLAEHDKYCNLYHSCILGKYQMYACLSIGEFDRTSFFYYTNGNCGSANARKCGINKSVYDYDRLFPNRMGQLINIDLPVQTSERFISKVASSVSTVTLHETYGPVIQIKNNPEYAPDCSNNEFLVADKQFCNLFYECKNSELSSFICIDNATGQLNGIFDIKMKKCLPLNMTQCLTNEIYNPAKEDIENILNKTDENTDDLLSSQTTTKTEDSTFRTNSNFSCYGRKNGYYESEWCNVFFQCYSGKRIDTRCSPSLSHSPDYDLWWVHQNAEYDSLMPLRMEGSDGEARCEWPCKIKCQKKIWTESSIGEEKSYKSILQIDTELRPECFSEKINQDEPLVEKLTSANKSMKSKKQEAIELKSPDPSGFICDNRIGIFKDPLFCNIFHKCNLQEKKSFMCKKQLDGSLSLYNPNIEGCDSNRDMFDKCDGLVYEEEFLYVPAIQNLPKNNKKCAKNGVFKAVGEDMKNYCDLFYWCSAINEPPIYFYCDIEFLTKEAAVFNLGTKRCELKQSDFCEKNDNIYSDTLKLKSSYFDRKEQMNSTKSMFDYKLNLNRISNYLMENNSPYFDPAPGYMSIQKTDFESRFECEFNQTGYFSDTEFCDIFHYCFPNGKFKTYSCPSVNSEYQTWWNYKDDGQNKHTEIFCDFSCSFKEANDECTQNKKILIKSKSFTEGIARDEVLSNICGSQTNIV